MPDLNPKRRSAVSRTASHRSPTLATITPLRSPSPAGIRWSRVRTARARLAAGFYERDDVQDSLIDAVLSELRRD